MSIIYFQNDLIYIKCICTSHKNDQIMTTFIINGHKKKFLNKKIGKTSKLINMEGSKI